jgi:hypothetical protein
LPVLNWSEGRASDVARTVIRGFSEYCDEFATSEEHLSIYLGLRYFHIDSGTREIAWVGHKANRTGAFFHLGRPVGCAAFFDTIVLAAGFGLETQMPGYSIESYWRNEQLAQPTLDGGQRRYLVSGFGDGALVDLCRLTIERFRQDTIVYELFEPDLSKVEKELRKRDRKNNVFNLFKAIEDELLSHAKTQLADRIRKDTRVTLHMRGRHNEITAFPQIFGSNSSFLNQLLTYLLYRCGAFAPDFSELAEAVKRYNVPDTNVLCRYGANTIEHLSALFVDSSRLAKRFAKMKQDQKQKPYRRWVPGIFPHLPTT